MTNPPTLREKIQAMNAQDLKELHRETSREIQHRYAAQRLNALRADWETEQTKR